MSHTTTTNSQSHHNCTPAYRSEPWGWYLCLQSNVGHPGALQKGALQLPALPAHTQRTCPSRLHLPNRSGGQMSWLETLIPISLQFSTKPPRSCNSPCKPAIIEEISSCRQQVEAHKSCPCNIHSKWIHQEAGCGKSVDITHKKSETAAENRWTNYKKWRKNNFTALQSVLQFISRREIWKNRREEKNTPKKA